VLLGAGIDVPHSCREDRCGSCVATVVEGEVEMASCDILEPGDLQDGLILACQSRPVRADLHIDFDRIYVRSPGTASVRHRLR
jgi:ferredoxin